MLRAFTLIVACLFSVGPAVSAEPPSAEANKQPAEFNRIIDLGNRRFEHTDLKVALEILRNKYKCGAALDEAAFEKRGIKSVGEKTIDLPKLGKAPTGLILEMIARQVGGTIRGEGGRIKVVPGQARDLKWLVAAPTPKLAADLGVFVKLDKPIDGSPIKDILEFLSDKYGLNIVVDDWGFQQHGTKNAGDTQCALPAGNIPLGQLLNQLGNLVNGSLVLSGDELVLIVPAKKGK